MFNLNENNRIVMTQHPCDMRIWVDGKCVQVRSLGLDPTNGGVYIFVGKSRRIMKLLHWERGGYSMYYKRLESCELVGVPPLQWLTHALENLYDDTTEKQLQALLPHNYKNLANNLREIFYAIKAGLFRMVTIRLFVILFFAVRWKWHDWHGAGGGVAVGKHRARLAS